MANKDIFSALPAQVVANRQRASDRHTQIASATDITELHPIRLGEVIRSYMRQYRVNIEGGQYYNTKGLSPKDNEWYKNFLYESEWGIQISRGIKLLFDRGKYVVGLIFKDQNVIGVKTGEPTPLLSICEVIYDEKFGSDYRVVWAQGADVYEVNGEAHSQIVRWYYDKAGTPKLDIGYYQDGLVTGGPFPDLKIIKERFKEIQTYTFKGSSLPVEVIPNNYEYQPEIQARGVEYLLEEIGRQSDLIGPEVDITKNNLFFNKTLLGDKGALDRAKQMAQSNVHDIDTADALQLMGAVMPLPAIQQGLPNIIGSVRTLIDLFEKYTFSLRDTISTGTNKFNAEIMMFNQISLDNTLQMKLLRSEAWTRFARKLFTETNAWGWTNAEPQKVFVEIQISQVEQIKLDTLKAQAENLQTRKMDIKTDQDSGEAKKENKDGGQ